MKKKIGIASVLVCLLLAVAAIGLSSGAATPKTLTKGNYFTPSADVCYVTEASLTEVPNTAEAWICLADDLAKDTRGGVICGNYDETDAASMNVEVFTGYHPRALLVSDDGTSQSYVFDKVTLPKGEYVHLAIVRDVAANSIRCYVNSELKQSLSLYGGQKITLAGEFGVGGDRKDGNKTYFRGEINSVVLFSTVRTAEEIETDQSVVADNADGLIAGWSFDSFTAGQETVADASGKYGLVRDAKWFTGFDAGTYDYTIAVVGDTQRLNCDNPDNYNALYDWLIAYRDKNDKPLGAVLGLGDITEHGEKWNDEWTRAVSAATKLKAAKIPFTMIPGNHDLYSGSADYFNQAFPVTLFQDNEAWGEKYYWGGSFEEGKTNNSYYDIKLGTTEYLIFALEYGPRDEVMEWAGKIIAANPTKQVIITTHAYIWPEDGRYVMPGDGGEMPAPSKKLGYNDGDDVWEQLASKYANIRMVICGHTGGNVRVQQKQGTNGNTVTEILCDPSGLDFKNVNEKGAGMVFLLHFSQDGNHVQTEFLSTVKAKANEPEYYKRNYQLSFDLNALDNMK